MIIPNFISNQRTRRPIQWRFNNRGLCLKCCYHLGKWGASPRPIRRSENWLSLIIYPSKMCSIFKLIKFCISASDLFSLITFPFFSWNSAGWKMYTCDGRKRTGIIYNLFWQFQIITARVLREIVWFTFWCEIFSQIKNEKLCVASEDEVGTREPRRRLALGSLLNAFA